MAEIIMGCEEVNVVNVPNPVFRVTKPENTLTVLLPVEGPPGPAGTLENLKWEFIQDKPTAYPPTPHVHPQSDVINLTANLNSINSSISSSEDMPDLTVLFENTIA